MCDNINFIARDYFLNALKNFYVFLCNKDFLKNFKLKFGTFSLGNLCTPRWKEACAMKILSSFEALFLAIYPFKILRYHYPKCNSGVLLAQC